MQKLYLFFIALFIGCSYISQVNLKKFLLSISGQSAEEQQKAIKKEFVNWLGTNEQIDDVCVMGVRV